MRAKHKAHRLAFLPVIFPAFLVRSFYAGYEIFARKRGGALKVKSVRKLAGWVVLGLEKRVKIPEAAFNYVALHLLKAHLQENFAYAPLKPVHHVALAAKNGVRGRAYVVFAQLRAFP